jgi:hypothetical protein
MRSNHAGRALLLGAWLAIASAAFAGCGSVAQNKPDAGATGGATGSGGATGAGGGGAGLGGGNGAGGGSGAGGAGGGSAAACVLGTSQVGSCVLH